MEIIIGRDQHTRKLCVVKNGVSVLYGQQGSVPMDVSRQHISLEALGNGKWQIKNLNERNVTYINGIAIESKTISENDKIKVFFLGYINGEMRFTTKIAGDKADKSMLENAFQNGIPVEGKVEKEIKGGFEVKIGETRGFCPYSQMGFKQKEEPSFYIGKVLSFKISEYKESGRNVLVSNRAILEAENQAKMDELKATLKVGMKVKGAIISLQKYGALRFSPAFYLRFLWYHHWKYQ